MFTITAFLFLLIFLFIVIGCIPAKETAMLKQTCFIGTCGLFFFSLGFWIESNPFLTKFQQLTCLSFFTNYNICFGLDGLSLYLTILTTFIFPLCFAMSWVSVSKNLKNYLLIFLLLEFCLITVFLVLDFFFFYVLFEFSLIPMFLLIGLWGTKERKSKAAYYLFLYTLFGSLFMLLALIYMLSATGSMNYYVLLTTEFAPSIQLLLWPAIFIAFAIKVPMFPFHIWLPEAHVEAPTAGSVLLAGIVLKLGGYGMLRFLIPLFPFATQYYSPGAFVLALMGAIFAGFTALRQIDMKRIIAYSSIAHMNFALLGLFSLTYEGIGGFYYVMLGHGLISSALFFLVGVLYDRYHSRLYSYYTGLTLRMPLYSIFFGFFTVANTAFPGTFNFVGELLVLCGSIQLSSTVVLCAIFSLFISTVYSFWLYNRIAFGTLNINSITFYYDLTRLESYLFMILTILTLGGGLFPNIIFPFLQGSILLLI